MRLLYHVTIRADIENSCRDLRITKKKYREIKHSNRCLHETKINKKGNEKKISINIFEILENILPLPRIFQISRE